MEIKEAKRTYRIQEMATAVKSCHESGLTIKVWCARHEIKEHVYYYWLKKVRKAALELAVAENENQNEAIVRVELPKKKEKSERGIQIQYMSYILDIPAGTEPSDITSVLKAIKEIC